jgi:hypothetical protein
MLVLGTREPEGASEGSHDLRGRVSRPALLQTHQIVSRDAGKGRELLAAQPGRTSPRSVRQPHVLGTNAVSPGPQRLGELGQQRSVSHLTSPLIVGLRVLWSGLPIVRMALWAHARS